VTYYLIVYDRARGRIREEHEYPLTETDRVWAHRESLISDAIADPDVEVVLLRADSRADLLKTHARYFRSFQEIVDAA
jgi:hypothetical protein